jgi:hypothetical protein
LMFYEQCSSFLFALSSAESKVYVNEICCDYIIDIIILALYSMDVLREGRTYHALGTVRENRQKDRLG